MFGDSYLLYSFVIVSRPKAVKIDRLNENWPDDMAEFAERLWNSGIVSRDVPQNFMVISSAAPAAFLSVPTLIQTLERGEGVKVKVSAALRSLWGYGDYGGSAGEASSMIGHILYPHSDPHCAIILTDERLIRELVAQIVKGFDILGRLSPNVIPFEFEPLKGCTISFEEGKNARLNLI